MRFWILVALLSLALAACSDSNGKGGGRGGDGGSNGSGGTGGAVGEPSPRMNELADLLASLDEGEPVDLDGDGHPEAREIRNEDGSSEYTSDRDGDGMPEYVRQDDGQGNVLTTIDADGDGVPEEIVEIEASADEQKRVVTRDTDRNGAMDHRTTWVITRENPDVAAFTEEADEDEDGTFTVLRSEQVPTSWDANGSGCDGTANFPDGANYPLMRGTVNILVGGDAGACKFDQVSMVREAFECAAEKGRACLADTNSKNLNDLNNALRGRNVTSLDIACGNPCAGAIASAKSFSRPWFMNSRLNFNMEEFGKLDDEGRCNIMLHELMHWAGNHGSADHNDPSGPGDDDVYSCGRYCGGCSNAGHGSPNNSAVDCARCADTQARKEACGTKVEYVEAGCGGALTGVCHAGLSCILGDCETCGGIVESDCNGDMIRNQATCCSACPSGCDASNDVPCNGQNTESDTCTPTNPPHCGG